MSNFGQILSNKFFFIISYYKSTETTGVLMIRLLVLFGTQGHCNLLFWVMDKKLSEPLI
jgi:hypothetical protein